MSKHLALFLALVAFASTALAAVEGRVLSASGTPVEHARIEVVGSDLAAYSDADGRFRLSDTDVPVDLKVLHPMFLDFDLRAEDAEAPLEIRLELKQQLYETIAVSATPGEENFAPVSVAISVIDPGETSAPPNTLTEFVAETPGVAENGQGGIFQTYSVRGVSRLRVMTLVSGMRIVSERRAGVSASFIDPLLIGTADIVRGPSSTYYGSGALGGVVQLFPEVDQGWTVRTGFDTRGDEVHQLVGWADEDWSFGVAHRDAGNSETPAGDELNSGFQQTSATLGRSWERGRLDYEVLAIGSTGTDIQKSNIDFPDRTTTYPDEAHGLVRFRVRSEAGWEFSAYAHPNELETQVSRSDGRVDSVENDAFDLGFNWLKRVKPSDSTSVRFGVDYFGRRSVDARETNRRIVDGALAVTGRQQTLSGGEEDEAGLYGALEWNVGKVTVLAGGRFAYQQQGNDGASDTDDSALTGFAGVVAPLGGGFEAVANAGTGLRFPALSERYFTGTTGRGFVTGNPGLDPERSLNVDLGLRWYGQKLFLSGYVFRNDIDDYIERIEVIPGELTFVNLTAGTLEGFELEGFYQLNSSFGLGFGGHSIEGRDEAGTPLADVPADSVFLSGRWQRGSWRWDGRLEARSRKSDPGSGEQSIPSVQLLSSSVSYEFDSGLTLAIAGRNLLDEEYFNSADSDVPLAAERSFSVSLGWRQ